MDNRDDVREFLTSRRARITPQQGGPARLHGSRRRVKGLRREEVALLAGVSTEYYIRLERGNAHRRLRRVLDGISRALQLDEAEHAHLLRPRPRREPGRSSRPPARPIAPAAGPAGVQQLIDAMRDVPAFVQNGRLDAVATNRLGAALFSRDVRLPQRP